jgi:hypothetical protein
MAWLSTGTELRLRSESLANNQWGAAPGQTYLWARALPYADLHVGRCAPLCSRWPALPPG